MKQSLNNPTYTRFIICLLLTGILLLPTSVRGALEPENTSNTAASFSPEVEALLNGLPGCWQGEAVKTPRGPLPYPLCFEPAERHTLYGVANLSVSEHHWRFYQMGQETRLRFLSTFAGNHTPVELTAVDIARDRLSFATDNENYLRVEILKQEKGYRLTITLKGREHVIIRLAENTEKTKKADKAK